MRPNVLLVVLDTARADALEPYGAEPGASPAIAQLARRGAALPRVYAPASWTVPSHASMLSGLLPRAHGLTQAPAGTPQGCRPVMEAHRERLLPEVLRRAGYATAGVSTNLWITEQSGFATGFDRFATVHSGRQGRMDDAAVGGRLRWALEGVLARVDDGAREAERIVRRWLASGPRRPFLWFVNLIECHSPYLPPRPYDDLSPLDRLRAAEEARRHLTLDAIWRACAGAFDVPEGALARMRHLYGRAVRLMDDWLGRVLEALDEGGLLADTLVIVTSDHGENFGEGGLIGHSFSLDDRLIHVPFVVAGPGAVASDAVHSLAELPRLVARAAGLDRHPWPDAELPAGVAVAQLDPPAGPDDPRVGPALARWGLGEEAAARITTPLACAADGRLKLLRRGDAEEVYDLAADPLELSPMAPGDPAVAAAALAPLRAALDHPAARAVLGAEPAPAAAPADEVAELESRMRLLGYM